MLEESKREKILIVIANLKVAGAQKMVEQLSLSIDKKMYDVRVLCISCPCDSPIEERMKKEKIPVDYLNKTAGFSVRTFFKADKYIRSYKPAIIHTHLSSAWIYTVLSALRFRIPILNTIHSRPNRQEANSLLASVIRYFYKRKVVIPVAISDQIREEAINFYSLSPDSVEMVYNPVDFRHFSNTKHIEHRGINYVNVARFNPVKNQLTLIEAFVSAKTVVPDIELYIAGDGEYMEKAIKKVERHQAGSYIHILGNVDDVRCLFEIADVFILPSLSEGLPVSVLEAEAARLPIIASNVGGIPDIVNENGILISPQDVESIKNAIITLANAPSVREKMGNYSLGIAQKYSSDVIAEEYMQLYKKYGRGL